MEINDELLQIINAGNKPADVDLDMIREYKKENPTSTSMDFMGYLEVNGKLRDLSDTKLMANFHRYVDILWKYEETEKLKSDESKPVTE